MLEASRVVLIGTGLNILQQDPFACDLMSRAARGDCQLEIYLADPTSPAVETRLIEEMLGNIRPPVTRAGLRQRLKTLLQQWERLGERFGHPDAISISLFTHYPTFALLIVDREYFIYPYGYAILGNFSPVLRFSVDTPSDEGVIKFLNGQYDRVKISALDARTAFGIHELRPRSSLEDLIENDLHPLALYFVPPEDSALYRFGTRILGYDVRKRSPSRSRWRSQVGDARDFGFHMTLSDALYFLTEAEVESVWAEVKFLAEDFKPFDLTGLRLAPSFPDATSLSIVMDDPSGSLEALHYELVHRVYRRAAASNYSLGLAKLVRDQDTQRARLMVERYKAPYILQRFRPHFTLLTNVPPEEQSTTCQELEKIFCEQVPGRTIRVRKLARMSRRLVTGAKTKNWVIEEETKLG